MRATAVRETKGLTLFHPRPDSAQQDDGTKAEQDIHIDKMRSRDLACIAGLDRFQEAGVTSDVACLRRGILTLLDPTSSNSDSEYTRCQPNLR